MLLFLVLVDDGSYFCKKVQREIEVLNIKVVSELIDEASLNM